MQNLHLVGFTKDRKHLIFSTRKGAKSGSFLVPVDDDLVEAIDEVASFADLGSEDDAAVEAERTPAPPRVESQLSVREVQARLRAGDAVSAVATDAGVDPEWVERFATPVRAEQRRVVEGAMAARLERPRAGESAVPLRTAVAASMVEREISMTAEQFDAAWSAHLLGSGEWLVGFTFKGRGGRRTLEWQFTPSTGTLTSKDRFATQLGFRSADDPLPAAEAMLGEEPAPEPVAAKRSSGGLAYPGTTPTTGATDRRSAPVRPPAPLGGGRPPRAIGTTSSAPVNTTPPAARRPPTSGPPAPYRSAPRGSAPRGSAPSGRPPSDMARPEPRRVAHEPVGPRGPLDDAPRRPAAAGPERPQGPIGDSIESTPVPNRPRSTSPGDRVARPSPIPPRPPQRSAPAASRPASAPIESAPDAPAGAGAVPDRRPAPPMPTRTPAPVAADIAGTSADDIPPSLRLIAVDDDSSIRVVPGPDDGVGPDDRGPGDDHEHPATSDETDDDADDVVEEIADAEDDSLDAEVDDTDDTDDTDDDTDDDTGTEAADDTDDTGTEDADTDDDASADVVGGDDDGSDQGKRTGRVRFATSEERTRGAVRTRDGDEPDAEEALGAEPDEYEGGEEAPEPVRHVESASDDAPTGDDSASDDEEPPAAIDWSAREPTRRRLKPLGEDDIKPAAERTRRRTSRRQVTARPESSATIRASRAAASDGELDGGGEAPSSASAPAVAGADAPKQEAASGPSKRRRRREPLRAR